MGRYALTKLAPPQPLASMTRLEQLLIKHEGYRNKVYNDSLGIPTIGVGHNLIHGLSNRTVDFILEEDIDNAMQACFRHLPFFHTLDTVRQDMLIEMCFNMGIATLLTFKNSLSALFSKDWTAAEEGFRASKWAKQVGEKRVNDICHMVRTGEYPIKGDGSWIY